MFALQLEGKSISEYYKTLRYIWEELDDLLDLHTITNITEEIVMFLKALAKQQKEKNVFQFIINEVGKEYNAQASQILVITALPNVEVRSKKNCL